MSTLPKFHGVMPALVTPMNDDFTVNENDFQQLCEWQIDQGVHGLVPVGTTGESPTLSHKEHLDVVKLCVDVAKGRVPVIAGAGSNNTSEAVYLAEEAQKIGADALLIVTPYYNKPSQEGLYQHYATIAKAVEIPIFIYNIPSRSVINMELDTFARLYEDFPHIKGVKDATSNPDLPLLIRKKLGKEFIQVSGNDSSLVAFLAQGGHGLISVSCNVAPKLHAQIQEAWLQRDFNTVETIRDKLCLLHEVCFTEPSPAPSKYALSLLGRCKPQVRPPILTLSDNAKKFVESCLLDLELI